MKRFAFSAALARGANSKIRHSSLNRDKNAAVSISVDAFCLQKTVETVSLILSWFPSALIAFTAFVKEWGLSKSLICLLTESRGMFTWSKKSLLESWASALLSSSVAFV